MRRWQLVTAGSTAFVLGLLAFAPATLIDAGLRGASGERLRLAEARGTLWSGSGTLEVRDASRRNALATPVAWRVLPAALLRGRLECEVGVDPAAKRFKVAFSPSRIEIAEAELNLPAAALSVALPRLAPLKLQGDLLLQIPQLTLGDGLLHGNAALRWSSAGSAITAVAPLGDYALQLESERGQDIRATLRTVRGPLQLDGQGVWRLGADPAFAATAQVPPQHREELAPLLRMIAIDRGDGRFDLKLN